MMDFRPESTIQSVEKGKHDGRLIVEKGEGVAFKEFMEWADSPELQEKYPFYDWLLDAKSKEEIEFIQK